MLRTNFWLTCLFVHLGSFLLFVYTDVKQWRVCKGLALRGSRYHTVLTLRTTYPSTLQSDISEDSGLHAAAAVLLGRPSLYQTACSACVHAISTSSRHPHSPAQWLPWCSFLPFPRAPVLLKNPGNFACCIFYPSFCLFSFFLIEVKFT